jgi:hypothetical protein
LPAPLIATLAMTTLLSSVPALKRLDAWLLSAFLEWGAIPAEVTRYAAALLPENLSVTEADVLAMRETYGGGDYGGTLATHLRASDGEGHALSEFRFTRVAKLYDSINRLAGEPRYERFFAENAEEYRALAERVDAFLRRSDTSLTIAAQLRAVEIAPEYEDLIHERRETFAIACRDVFRELARFLAHAILRSEKTEDDIVRLRTTAFGNAHRTNVPAFPIDSLTLLGISIFVYLGGVTLFFNNVYPQPGNIVPSSTLLILTMKIALSRLAAIGVVVLLMQRCVASFGAGPECRIDTLPISSAA